MTSFAENYWSKTIFSNLIASSASALNDGAAQYWRLISIDLASWRFFDGSLVSWEIAPNSRSASLELQGILDNFNFFYKNKI